MKNSIKNIDEILREDSWVTAMEEELSQFIKNRVWNLVPPTKNQLVIGTCRNLPFCG